MSPESPKAAAEQTEKGEIDYGSKVRSVKKGDIIKGRVVHIDEEGVLVDVGTKTEGRIPLAELSSKPFSHPQEVVSVKDKVDVYVLAVRDSEGALVLSKKRADYEKAWQKIIQAHKTQKPILGKISGQVRGGFLVDVGDVNINAFVPMSQMGPRRIKGIQKFIGSRLRFKVTEADKRANKVILSHRAVLDEERERRRREALARLKEGEIYRGKVKTITDYGAFIGLGGVDGLLHISEMSWTHIEHPSEVLRIGQPIRVKVLKIDPEGERIALGLKQILPDPWMNLENDYKVGQSVMGKVTKLLPFGALVQLPNKLEGLVPISELSPRRVSDPKEVLSVGDKVEVKILELNPQAHKISLSLRQAQQEKEKKYFQTYIKRQQPERITLGDLWGDRLSQANLSIKEARRERRRERRRRK